MKFYSIKYLETKGIEEFEGKVVQGEYANGLDDNNGRAFTRFEKIGRDAFNTEMEARARARMKLDRSITASEKKIAKAIKLRNSL